MDKSVHSQWCPECEQYQCYVGIRCTGCDITDDELDEMIEEGHTDVLDETSKRQWAQEDWVAVKRFEGPQFAGGTKKDCMNQLSEELGVSISTSRICPGLYEYSNEWLIGRPGAFEDRGIGQALNPK